MHEGGAGTGISANYRGFEVFFTRARPLVYSICLRILHDPHDAEEATQEAFLRTASRLDGLTGDWEDYVAAAARRCACDVIRARRARCRRATLVGPTEIRRPVCEAEIAERADLGRAWIRLSCRDRQLIMDSFAGFSHTEIAERMGISAKSVSMGLSRARHRARVLLEAVEA